MISCVILPGLLALAACRPFSGISSSPTGALASPTGASTQDPAVASWLRYANDAAGFALRYPPQVQLSEDTAAGQLMLTFPIAPDTNVLEEYGLLIYKGGTGECVDPLAEGWTPEELDTQDIVLNGLTFQKQSHAGVAAGTSRIWVAYTTQRGERCVSLGFLLSTYAPANLDPTRFPTPPAAIDWQAELDLFESVVSTFEWLQ
jgi:hypothetical protein